MAHAQCAITNSLIASELETDGVVNSVDEKLEIVTFFLMIKRKALLDIALPGDKFTNRIHAQYKFQMDWIYGVDITCYYIK